MKKILFIVGIFVFLFTLQGVGETIQPFYSVGSSNRSMDEQINLLTKTITDAGFQVIGSYHPAENPNLFVLCFTNDALRKLSLQFSDRGALGSILKAAVVKKEDKTVVSFQNPEYMFLAYWGKELNGQNAHLISLSDKVTEAFRSLGTLTPFGGKVDKEDLSGYHYKFLMPYFTDPDELHTFGSFEEGLSVIRKNLLAKKGNTLKVYEQLFKKEKIAVFGVGLLNKEDGEAFFLPIIGEDNIAAMPYEIILQGKEATALPGKYRFALYWPELSMGTFMKIISTPGDIEHMLKALTEE